MKQMKSVEKLTQGLSTSHTKSQKNIEIDFTDEMSDHSRSFNLE